VQGGLSLAPSQYPAAVRNDSLKEVRFGQTVADPYRWLETNSSARAPVRPPPAREHAAALPAANAVCARAVALCSGRVRVAGRRRGAVLWCAGQVSGARGCVQRLRGCLGGS